MCVCVLGDDGVDEDNGKMLHRLPECGLEGTKTRSAPHKLAQGLQGWEGGDRPMSVPHTGSKQREKAVPSQDSLAPSHLEDRAVSCYKATSVSQMSGTCKKFPHQALWG